MKFSFPKWNRKFNLACGFNHNNKYVFISTGLHALLLSLLLFQGPAVNKQEIVEIEIKNLSLPDLAGSKADSKNKTQKPAGKFSKIHGSKNKESWAFQPRLKYFEKDGMAVGKDYLSSPNKDDVDAAWGSGSGDFGRITDYNLFHWLYEKIDGAFYYPGVLARRKIKGTVNARLVLNAKGKCDWTHTQLSGGHSYLQLVVLDTLKQVCKHDYAEYMNQRQITNVDMSFQFDINENDDWERVKLQQMVAGNTMLFYRNSHQSIMQWELGPFRGMWPIPMVYLNIPWLMENWERLVNHKDPITEFKKEFGEGT